MTHKISQLLIRYDKLSVGTLLSPRKDWLTARYLNQVLVCIDWRTKFVKHSKSTKLNFCCLVDFVNKFILNLRSLEHYKQQGLKFSQSP